MAEQTGSGSMPGAWTPAAAGLVAVAGWSPDEVVVRHGHLPTQRQVVNHGEGWWIVIDGPTWAPPGRVRLCAGWVSDQGTCTEVSAVLDAPVQAADPAALAEAVAELRRRLEDPGAQNGWAAGHYGQGGLVGPTQPSS